MIRAFSTSLQRWKRRRRRKPLIVRGARQVGKTYSITAFGEREFEDVRAFNFEEDRSLHKVFAGDLRPELLLMQLEAHCGKRIVPGSHLVFFDEIQACPRALTSLRYFYEKSPELHIVAAGSLLEFALDDISFPVGRVDMEWMRPMSFSEFLAADGADILLEHLPGLDSVAPLPVSIHERLLEKLRVYFAVGGLPEAVAAFAATHSLEEVGAVHKSLCASYTVDFAKYGRRVDRDCLEHVFEELPAHAGRQIKYTSLYPEKRVEKIKGCLRVLRRASIVSEVRSTAAQGLPLRAGASSKVFKCLFLDIGLMQHLCGIRPKEILEARNILDIWRGGLAEQFVGQELLAQRGGSEDGRLYYWSRPKKSSTAEVDYVIVGDKGEILPIEVKSGQPGRLRSMRLFLDEHPGCDEGLVLSSANVSGAPEHGLRFLPLYTRYGDASASASA